MLSFISKGGVKRKVSYCSVWRFIWVLMELRVNNGYVIVKSIVEKSGFSFEMVSRRMFLCYFNENGYGYL